MISFEVRPRRLLDWREQDGRCVLLRPRLGPSRAGRWLAGLVGDPHYRIRLDEVGAFVWKACDGRTSLAEIARSMRSAFGARVEPADERLAAFVRRMLKGRMLAVDEPHGAGRRGRVPAPPGAGEVRPESGSSDPPSARQDVR